MDNSEKAIYILSYTNDGDDLTQKDLILVEMAVNGELNELGETKFKTLYEQIKTEGYNYPIL